MGYGKPKEIKIVLPSDKKYWVKVRAGIPYGELKNFGQFGGDGGWLPTEQKLLMSIVAWNLDDDDGKVLPITAENVDLLQESDVIAIGDVINPNRGQDEEELQKK